MRYFLPGVGGAFVACSCLWDAREEGCLLAPCERRGRGGTSAFPISSRALQMGSRLFHYVHDNYPAKTWKPAPSKPQQLERRKHLPAHSFPSLGANSSHTPLQVGSCSFCITNHHFPEANQAPSIAAIPHLFPIYRKMGKSILRAGVCSLHCSVGLGWWWDRGHRRCCPSCEAKPSSSTRLRGRERSTGTGRCCLASLTRILWSFITSDRWQEMSLPLQMLIISRAVNNVSRQLAHQLRCERPSSFALARGQKVKRKESHGEGDPWVCLALHAPSPGGCWRTSWPAVAHLPLGTKIVHQPL